jgi:RNA polymerase sigma factor (sigma-70 family)
MNVTDNKSSFETVVMPHLSDALTLARWLTKNHADAEDVVQEACLRAFRAIGSYSGGSPRAWLLAIVRNTAFSWLEKNRSTRTVSVEDLDAVDRISLERGEASGSDDAATPEAILIAKASAIQLEAAIEALPIAFREVLVLREIHQLDYREISRIVGIPVGTVMSRLSRARRHVAVMLSEGPADAG